MKPILFVFLLFAAFPFSLKAQQNKNLSIAVFTTQNAMPFGKASGLLSETFHPGIEAGIGKILSVKPKHKWYAEARLGYFYHRFVQHGIPLYLNLGYRHQITTRIAGRVSLGTGYMHSIPATAQLKQNNNGEYSKRKGAGRMQALAAMGLGLEYEAFRRTQNPLGFFIEYQQKIQFPFVKSYVPLLPYTSLFVGIKKNLKTK